MCTWQGNCQDPYAVAVVRSAVVVSHIPKKISSVCSMFLRQSGTIKCQVMASKRYSEDLPQLEIPCTLMFKSQADLVKAKKLVKCALSAIPAASKEASKEGLDCR